MIFQGVLISNSLTYEMTDCWMGCNFMLQKQRMSIKKLIILKKLF